MREGEAEIVSAFWRSNVSRTIASCIGRNVLLVERTVQHNASMEGARIAEDFITSSLDAYS